MSDYSDSPGVAIQVSRDIVMASIQVDLDDDVISRFREDLLQRIYETGSRGVILDVSALETIDSVEFTALRNIILMAKIMGAESVLSGLRPGVVSALVESEIDVEGLRTAINLDAAFELIQANLEQSSEPQEKTYSELESCDDDPTLVSGDFSADVKEE
jgi:rsbT antagonist protein RsbS